MNETGPQETKKETPEDKFNALKKVTEAKYGIGLEPDLNTQIPAVSQKKQKPEKKVKEAAVKNEPVSGQSKPKKKLNLKLPFKKVLLFTLCLVFLAGFSYTIHRLTLKYFCFNCEIKKLEVLNPFGSKLNNLAFGLETFSSKEEFVDYVKNSASSSLTGFIDSPSLMRNFAEDAEVGLQMAPTAGGGLPKRVSTTNVQVTGIDEPDIVKTDGQNIYTSIQSGYYYDYGASPANTTSIIQAFPPAELEKIGGLDKIGNLLLSQNVLVIFADREVYGYNVADPTKPVELWKIPYEEKTAYKDARLYQNTVYLITSSILNWNEPCPYRPVILEGEDFSIPCTGIYHPKRVVPINVTYTILKINPATGKVDDSLSLVGSENEAVIYMSEDNLYVSYSYHEDYVKIYLDFIKNSAADLFSTGFIQDLEQLAEYDLSNETKMMELMQRITAYQYSLSEDEMLRIQNELQNRLDTYTKEHAREYESTGLVRISRKDLDIEATGTVPGHPLNQFSLDEYEGYLRIAVNAGSAQWSTVGDVNDVYILNKSLKEVGKVTDLGQDERIYSARFIKDKAYIVTFRETDPFYVLDLSNPRTPQMKGELKIPGYSSYLHPLRDNIILGVGMEGSQVKLSLFDVSNAAEPVELDKYLLDEYWSEISNTHHAFLQDEVHEIFFLPGSKGAYIFSYDDNKLSLQKTDSAINVKRAIYLDNYLYIITDNKIVALDEKTWEMVKELEYNPAPSPEVYPPLPIPF